MHGRRKERDGKDGVSVCWRSTSNGQASGGRLKSRKIGGARRKPAKLSTRIMERYNGSRDEATDEVRDTKASNVSNMLAISLRGVQDKAGIHCAQEIIDLVNNEDFDPVAFGKLVRSTEDCERITDDIVRKCTTLL